MFQHGMQCISMSSLREKQMHYLLHADLWLSSYMLLGVANSCGVLVLRDSPHRGTCGCSGGCGRRAGAHGLSGYSQTDRILKEWYKTGNTLAFTLQQDFFHFISDWPTRCVDIMRVIWEAGRMAPKVWGRGAEGRIVPGMFWKSKNKKTQQGFTLPVLFNASLRGNDSKSKGGAAVWKIYVYLRCGRTPWVAQRGPGRSWAICPAG